MRRRKLGADEMRAFRAPFRELQARRGMHVFPAEITAANDFLAGCEAFVQGFKGPAAFIWPERDIAFREKELTRWRSLLPQAEVARLPNYGHFLWLDAPEDMSRRRARLHAKGVASRIRGSASPVAVA